MGMGFFCPFAHTLSGSQQVPCLMHEGGSLAMSNAVADCTKYSP